MTVRRYDIVLCRREPQQLTLETLAARAGMHPALVERFVEFGLIEPVEWEGATIAFRCFRRAATAHDRTAARIFGYQSRGHCGHPGFARPIVRSAARKRNAA